MSEYQIPGVYIEEKSVFPPSVSATATAVPAFLGYTSIEVAEPQKIQSLLEFEAMFGLPPVSSGPTVTLTGGANPQPRIDPLVPRKPFFLYYYIEHYFRNGGGPCYVISTGVASDNPSAGDYLQGLDKLKKLDEPTLIVLSDAMATLEAASGSYADRHTAYFSVLDAALQQCGALMDRFVIVDMPDAGNDIAAGAAAFRTAVGAFPSYAAAYYPYLDTTITSRAVFSYTEMSWLDLNDGKNYSGWVSARNKLPLLSFNGNVRPSVEIQANDTNAADATFELSMNGDDPILVLKLKTGERYTPAQITAAFGLLTPNGGFSLKPNSPSGISANDYDAAAFLAPTLTEVPVAGDVAKLKAEQPNAYARIVAEVAKSTLRLPPAPAMAGIYASVDRDRGVWKSPANVPLSAVVGPSVNLSRDNQALLDVDATSGKAINCIVQFTGKGTLPWGARTLDAANLDWRYISVRRLFIMAEESVKKAAQFAVFEANDKNTWSKVKAMINNFLYSLWQKGALQGGKPEEAYFVQVGLGETMSFDDVLAGRMIVQVGLAAVRPAEFIILRFSQMQQNA